VRQSAVCGVLAIEDLDALAAIVSQTRYAPNQTVYRAGEDAAYVFIVNSGFATVSKQLADGRRQVLGFYYPADYIGYVTRACYESSATAVTPLTLCRIQRDQFEALLDKFPCLISALNRQTHREIVKTADLMLMLGKKSAIEKIASFLLELSERARQQGLPDTPVWIPMARKDVGDYLGLTIETISRALSELEQLGTIKKRSNVKIELTNRTMLREISQGP